MLPLRPFQLHQPQDVLEACGMLQAFGDQGKAYAGGTELLLAMKFDVLHYDHLVDVKTVAGLDQVSVQEGWLDIGALATHYVLERSPVIRKHLPVVSEMESRVANVRVRAAGTIGGNLCFAEPHSDPATLFTVLGARVVLQRGTQQRELPLGEFVIDAYETALKEDELLTRIRIPLLEKGQKVTYSKFQTHERPTLGLALLLEIPEAGGPVTAARAAVGCVSPFPRRSEAAEKLLLGEPAAVLDRLQEAADALADQAELVDDLEGRVDYKRSLIHTFLRRSYQQLI